MIYFLLTDGCERYNTFSPYYNFVKDKEQLELTGVCKVFSIPEGGYEEMQKIVGDEKPTAIVCDPISYVYFKSFPGVKLLITNDMHRFTEADRDLFEQAIEWATAVLNPYYLSYTRITEYFYPANLGTKEIFFPHHISCKPPEAPARFEDRIDMLYVGGNKDSRVYPMRHFAAKLKNAYRPNGRLDREAFMEHMGCYKYAFTCGAWSHYTVAKYFEIMKAGAVLIAEDPPTRLERALLGLTSGHNCYLIKEKEELLELPELTGDIARRGFNLVMKRHTTLNRVRQIAILVNHLYHGQKMLAGNSYLEEQLELG